VPRERFIPEGRMAMAYADAMVPLKPGREMNNPMALGRLPHLRPAPQEGETGARRRRGHRLCRRRAEPPRRARDRGRRRMSSSQPLRAGALAGYPVTVIEGPSGEGHAAGGPYDLILVDGAIEYVPDSLIRPAYRPRRLAAAMLDNGVSRLSLGRKAGDGVRHGGVHRRGRGVLPGFRQTEDIHF
jgi:protein-L-isoaspartate(D-aspartate) O-methyltransferase